MEIDKDLESKMLSTISQDLPKNKIAIDAVKNSEIEESVRIANKAPVRDNLGRSYGTGGRKSAKARVWVKPGNGKITVNGKDVSDYFKRSILKMIIEQPFAETKTLGQFDVFATVKGSGLSGQAGAIRHGLSNALSNYDPKAYHTFLRAAGLVTRDSRAVERKKYGQKKARKKFQFSKR
jgi:small subunit ribosomal protein S9